MTCLYLTQSGTKLARMGRRVRLLKDDEEIFSLPIHQIERILIFGRIQITADTLSLLLSKGIPLCLFTSKGIFRGSLVPAKATNFKLKQKLYAATLSEQKKLAFSKAIVFAKILSSRAVLQRYQANHPETKFYSAISELLELANNTRLAENIESLRGIEGAAARLYFAQWREIFSEPPLTFPGRIRRPPRDPINSLLSFAYVLLTGLIQGMLISHELDPWSGLYHSNVRSAPALTLDIIEQFRQPIADRYIFYCFHKKIIGPTDFETLLNGQVTLKYQAKKKFLAKWEEWLRLNQRWRRKIAKTSAIELIHTQIDKFANSLLSESKYNPFILE